jgi:hypothetical protein
MISVGNCPLAAGSYTFTQTSGGVLQVATFSPFPLPPGATLVEDVGAGDANCVHDVVVPSPGGFNAPVFCVPALGYLVKVTQSGCGVGEIDSNGGSDFTITERGDTSDSSQTCNLPQVCSPGKDDSVRIDITVGDETPDTCSGQNMGNVITSVPVDTLTWQDNATDAHGNPITFPPGCAGNACTACAGNGTFDPPTDIKINEFPQILDFTTDTTTAKWVDLDGDGCSLAGAGPASLSATGMCLDLTAQTVTLVAAGTVGSEALPYDLTYLEVSPNTFERTGEETGATCASPPLIDFAGSATRCLRQSTATETPTATFTASATPTGTLTATPTPTAIKCVGDCNGDGQVSIDELVRGVSIALGYQPLSSCSAFDRSGDGEVGIFELINAVNNALYGCQPPPVSAAR